VNNKKWSNILASTIVLSTVFSPLAASAEAPAGSQVVTSKGDALQQARELGLLVGDPNGELRPNDRLTRMELAKIFCSLFQLEVEAAQTPAFSDVAANDWGFNYVETVRKAGLMQGDGTSFRPNDLITREELAVVLVRGLGLDAAGKGSQLSAADKAQISGWAQDAVQTVLELGLMQASGDSFAPQQALNRHEIAVVAVGVIDRPSGQVQVSAGTLTIAGISYQVSEALQGLLSANNSAVLQNAKFELERDGYKIIGIKNLELQQQEGVLDAGGSVLTGNLSVKGSVTLKNVTVKGKLQVTGNGNAPAQVILENAALTSVEANNSQITARGTTQVADAVVKGAASITVEGNASFDKLRLADGSGEVQLKGTVKNVVLEGATHAKITLLKGAKIQDLTLPAGFVTKDLFNQYDAIKSNIPLVNGSTNVDLIVSSPRDEEAQANRTALLAKIAEAMALNNVAVVGSTPGTYPQAALDAFVQAIANALEVSKKPNLSQAQVNAAVVTLQQAIVTFKASVNQEAEDVTGALRTAIAAAEALKADAVVGTTAGTYPQNAVDAFTQAIADAQAVADQPGTTQEQADAAVVALQQATESFKASVNQDAGDVTGALRTAIAAAEALKANAPVGNTTGKYPLSAVDIFTQAIADAQAVADQAGTTQEQADAAAEALAQAVAAFQQAKLAPLTVELNPAAQFPMNSNLPGTSGDVVLQSTDPGFPAYNKRSIKNLIQIKRGSEVETFKYKAGTNTYEIDNANGEAIAELTLGSNSNLVTLSAAQNGVNVHPLDEATETSEVSLQFTVMEDQTLVGNLALAIRFDETAPQVTGATYADSQFELTTNEPILLPMGNIPDVQVEFAADGDFETNAPVVLVKQTDYSFAAGSGNQLLITLTDAGKAQLSVQQGSKFRFKIQGYTDFANNAINSTFVLGVDQL
jgi:hypothetical protein